jgi:hypothetical protein
MNMRPVRSTRLAAFVLVAQKAIFADAGAAGIAVEFIAVANLISAFSAFYGSVDELKHGIFLYPSGSGKSHQKMHFIPVDHCGLAWFHYAGQWKHREFFRSFWRAAGAP